MRENQLQWVLVVNRDRTPAGILWESDVAQAVRDQRTDLPWSSVHEMPTVNEQVPLADCSPSRRNIWLPLVVTDERGRTTGVIPRVTLLAAAASQEIDGADAGTNAEDGDR